MPNLAQGLRTHDPVPGGTTQPPLPPGAAAASPPDVPDWLTDIFTGSSAQAGPNSETMLAELRPKGPFREVQVPQRLVARLIGKGGEVIMSMCSSTGADIKVRQETKHLGYSLAIITGPEKAMKVAEELVKQRLGIAGENAGTREMLIASEHVSSLIGPRGATITEMRLKCNNLNIEIRPSDTPENTNASHKVIMGPGDVSQLNMAEVPATQQAKPVEPESTTDKYAMYIQPVYVQYISQVVSYYQLRC
ncbi:unnamed protein product [Cladocopium goreaui]|uniref:Tudor and KH domain-containing protein (Tudor domain-containing protein 2) n=1 Tax=Cladocopium goreaui TaxID=2562237 RepID=A0A9P1DPA2_9DINO|nr:unnamed protein product [Cladocopium goreaui]